MKRLIRPFLLSFLTLLPLSAAAIVNTKPEDVGLSPERLERIHEVMQRHIDERQISGAVTMVLRKGRVAHLEAHGHSDTEANKLMAKDSLFRIWSMSKPVAGAAILMLMEEGKVRLNDPVSKFIPEFKELKVAAGQERVAATREITIQDLLTHVSGLGSGPLGNAEIAKNRLTKEDSLATFIPRWGATVLEFQPGARWTYSPLAAFDTLGRVVEVASGKTFDQFLRQRFFEPLGMTETHFHPAAESLARVPGRYHRDGAKLVKIDGPATSMFGPTYYSGGVGLYSTARDYAQFAEMLLEGGQLNGKRFLSPKTVDLMASVFVPDTVPGRSPGRGFGLSVQVVSDPIAANIRVSKGSYGWDGAFGTHFWIDPKEKIVGIMMIQTDNPNRQLDRDFENAVMQAIVD